MLLMTLALVVAKQSVVGQTWSPWRVPLSPYPMSAGGPNATTFLTAFNDTALTQTQLLTIQTLQGMQARNIPRCEWRRRFHGLALWIGIDLT